MKQRYTGSIQSTNTPVYSNTGNSREDHALYRCMVIDVIYIDDPRNISKNAQNPEVLYDCVILGGASAGQLLSNCRLTSYLDGQNYSERTLKKATKDLLTTPLSENDGDIVYVQFIQGHDAYPVITTMARSAKQIKASKQADAPRFIEGFNGHETLIDNKGDVTITTKGGELKEGIFTEGTEALVTQKISKEVITTTFKSGLSITIDGTNDKYEVKTASGVTTNVDGKGNKISIKAGSAEVEIDGASGKISLKGDMVELGSSVSDFVTMFTQLATAFNSHTHMVPQAPAGQLPSMPPMAPLLTSVGSQTVKVQS